MVFWFKTLVIRSALTPIFLPTASPTEYEEEKNFVQKVEVSRSRFSGKGEDQTAFEVISTWLPEDGQTPQGSAATSVPVDQSDRHVVWRTFSDFKLLHKQLLVQAGASFLVEFPKSQWCVSLKTVLQLLL
jgi:hypothetical protein